jgi:hypothetical protein
MKRRHSGSEVLAFEGGEVQQRGEGMFEQQKQHNRLLLEIDARRRNLNREVLNGLIPELKMEDIEPILAMVARARGAYIAELFEVSRQCGNQQPKIENIKRLHAFGQIFEELVDAAQALEVAIERGYLDVVEPPQRRA